MYWWGMFGGFEELNLLDVAVAGGEVNGREFPRTLKPITQSCQQPLVQMVGQTGLFDPKADHRFPGINIGQYIGVHFLHNWLVG